MRISFIKAHGFGHQTPLCQLPALRKQEHTLAHHSQRHQRTVGISKS